MTPEDFVVHQSKELHHQRGLRLVQGLCLASLGLNKKPCKCFWKPPEFWGCFFSGSGKKNTQRSAKQKRFLEQKNLESGSFAFF